MIETRIRIDGMMCSMCESHINDVIRRSFKVKKVSSSHSKGETIIISESELDKEKVEQAIAETGYKAIEITTRPYVKKGIFSIFKK